VLQDLPFLFVGGTFQGQVFVTIPGCWQVDDYPVRVQDEVLATRDATSHPL
jgi:hypothetical protein